MKIKGLGVVVLATLAAGCANTNLQVMKPVSSAPKKVSLSVVNKTNSGDLELEMLGLKRVLTAQLIDEGIEVVADNNGGASLIGEFDYYNSGNRALRMFVGFGAGKIAYSSNWKVVSATGEEAGRCKVDGWRAMGFFGGSLGSVHDDMAEAVADCTKGKD